MGLSMMDIAIVGGGMTGLALAKTLEEKGFDYSLFEAQNRLGGRVLSGHCLVPDISVDLAPTWYWPQTQPLMAKLVSALGLTTFAQYDDGTVWVLTDPNEKPQKLENEMLHADALRIAGGMGRLVEAIASRLRPSRIRLSNSLISLRDMGTHMEMLFATPAGEIERTARQVVLAMPPRLIEEHIFFSPSLPEKVQRALLARPTWMARQAKAVVVYSDASGFRERVGSGNAFVHHEQAVLSEVFDASSMGGDVAALGGFLALTPTDRARFREGLEMLVTSQFVQLFGPGFESGILHYQDWANEPFTCSSLDRRENSVSTYAHAGDPCLRNGLWDGKLWFAGAEFAARQAGYLEGALIDAGRIAGRLTESNAGRFDEARLQRA
jgi:monoamine oxidase